MSCSNRQFPWAEPTQTSNTNRRRVFDDDDDTSNMQMARRPQQSSRPSHPTSGALTRRPTECNRPVERVESWRDEQRDDNLSGAMTRMRVSDRPAAASPSSHRPRSPSPGQTSVSRRPAPRQRAASPPAPTRRRPSPSPARTRRAPSPDWNENEPVRPRPPRRPAPRSPSPPSERTRRARSPSPFDNRFDNESSIRRRPHDFSDATLTRNRITPRIEPTPTGRRMRDTYRSTHHQPGMRHDPGCQFCFATQGEAVRAASEWGAQGEDCWVEWDAHGLGLWGVVFDVGGSRAVGGGEWWYS